MNKRWKYQIKTGALWGVFMSGIMAWFRIKEMPLLEQLQDAQFYFRFVILMLFGVFILGYSSWKNKEKRMTKP